MVWMLKLIKLTLKFIKRKYPIAGAPVIIQNSKGEILLGKREKKHVLFPDYWGLPGGMVEYGEHLTEAAKREIKEELGIDINIIKKSKNYYENLPNNRCPIHTVDIPHYGKILNHGKPQALDETSKIKWFKPSEIKNMELAYTHKDLLEGEGLI